MQSLIHGNFEGAAQKRVYALVGAAAAIAAAVGPLLGGFITTFLSWRIAFLLEVVIIGVVLSGIKMVHDVPYTGSREVDVVGALLSILGMGGIVLGILVWQEGGEYVLAILVSGAIALFGFASWIVRRKRQSKAALIDPDLFRSKHFQLGISQQMLQQIALGGAMIALPIYLQMVLEYNAMQAGLSIAPLSLSMFAVALLAGRKAGARRPSTIVRVGFLLLALGMGLLIPLVPRADSGWYLLGPTGDRRIGLGPAGLSAQQLHAGADLGGEGQRGRWSQLGRGILRAVLRTGILRRHHAGHARFLLHEPGRRRAPSCRRPTRSGLPWLSRRMRR